MEEKGLSAAFERLNRSAFRRRFHLSAEMKRYVAEKGLGTIRRHAPAHPPNDGRQTPMKGHPVFLAQHATATCCRGCLNRWWHVPLNVPLSALQQQKIVNLILAWILRQVSAPQIRMA